MDLGAFLHWLDTRQWGSVADWFSGCLTAGALILGLVILFSDRRSARRSLADGFVTWTAPMTVVRPYHGTEHGVWSLTVYCHNTSGAPITFARVILIRWNAPFQTMEFEPDTGDWQIPIDGKGSASFVLQTNPNEIRPYVEFSDARGNRWVRDAQANKLVSARKWNRIWTRAIKIWRAHNEAELASAPRQINQDEAV